MLDNIVSIIGRNGFLGAALAKKFKTVYPYPHPDSEFVFYFGSPSSQQIFKETPSYSIKETINGFINVVEFCQEHEIKLVYPSSGTVYHKNNSYAHTKSALEEIHQAYGIDALGLRIFGGYGVGEEHKGEYASIIYQFCKQMRNGREPVLWGDGTQTRDFVYIDDIVDSILKLKDLNGIYDIGTGINTSFTDIVGLINTELKSLIKPIYINAPVNYMHDTVCKNPIKAKVSVKEGIHRICESL